MAADERENQELSRRIRDELDRIRDAEGRVEEALESVRQARRRVELIARDLGREELRVRALVREELRAAGDTRATGIPLVPPTDPGAEAESARALRSDAAAGWARRAPASEAEAIPVAAPLSEPIRVEGPVLAPPAPSRREGDVPLPSARPSHGGAEKERSKMIGIGAAALIAVVLIGVVAIRGLQRSATPVPPSDVASVEVPPSAPGPDPAIADPGSVAPPSVLASLPADPAARTALYDSLWSARSTLFDSLLAAVERDSDDRATDRAVESWREGGVDVQEGDLLHSAFVQEVIRLRTGREIDIDGQVLRNPCRGSSCSALLDLWRGQRERYGLPEVPADAATNTTALRQVEVALVLDWMKETGATPATP